MCRFTRIYEKWFKYSEGWGIWRINTGLRFDYVKYFFACHRYLAAIRQVQYWVCWVFVECLFNIVCWVQYLGNLKFKYVSIKMLMVLIEKLDFRFTPWKILISNICVPVFMLSHFGSVWLFVTLWTTGHQAPLSRLANNSLISSIYSTNVEELLMPLYEPFILENSNRSSEFCYGQILKQIIPYLKN